jgi:hypothetical protein
MKKKIIPVTLSIDMTATYAIDFPCSGTVLRAAGDGKWLLLPTLKNGFFRQWRCGKIS